MHFQEFGDRKNPTMILVHGYILRRPTFGKRWRPKFAESGFHVIAVDLIGYGFSEKPAWFDYKIASQSRMIARLMNRSWNRKSYSCRKLLWRRGFVLVYA